MSKMYTERVLLYHSEAYITYDPTGERASTIMCRYACVNGERVELSVAKKLPPNLSDSELKPQFLELAYELERTIQKLYILGLF